MKIRMALFFVLSFAAAAIGGAIDEIADIAEATPGRTGVCITEMDGGERVVIPLTVLGATGINVTRLSAVSFRIDRRPERIGGCWFTADGLALLPVQSAARLSSRWDG